MSIDTELAVPEPRPFNPADPPRTWVLEDEQPSFWPKKFIVGGLEVSYRAGVLYRFYDADRRLLYVGIAAGDPTYRWTKHRHESKWWHLAAFVSIAHVSPINSRRRALERTAIRTERPLYNKAHLKPRVRLDVRLDQGSASVVDQFRNVLLPEDFAALVCAFKTEPDMPPASNPTY